MKRRLLHVRIAKPDVRPSGLRLSSPPPIPLFPALPSASNSSYLHIHSTDNHSSRHSSLIVFYFVPPIFFKLLFPFLYQKPITTFCPLLSFFFLPLFLESFFKSPAVHHHSHSTLWIQLNLILYI